MRSHLEAREHSPALAHINFPQLEPAVDLWDALLDLLGAQQQRIHIVTVFAAPCVQAAQRIHLLLETKAPCTMTSVSHSALIFPISSSLDSACITDPAPKKSNALKKAWSTR